MILVDDRIGSKELLYSIRRLGVDAEIPGHIDADFQFSGNGPDGPILIGVERKRINNSDFIDSMRKRRLAGHQVGTMLDAYDVSYLVVEGIWRRGRNSGLLEIRDGEWHLARGNVYYAEVLHFLSSLRELGGLRVWRTADEDETASYIVEEYKWWQKKWSEHKTGQTIYAPVPIRPRVGTRASFRPKATLVERWLSQLTGIDARAYSLAPLFSSGRDLANSEPDRWVTIPGIGTKTAERIVGEITGWTGK